MRKTIAAATMAASLTIGGAAGAVLFTPTLSGAQTDDTAETTTPERPRIAERIRETLQPLVDDSTITADQADAVAGHLAENGPRDHGGGFRGGFGEEVAQVLGLEVDELRTRLAGGESLADVAEAEGVDVQAVVDAIVAAHQERLDQAVEDDRLTQEEADERAADLEAHAEELVERTFEPGEGRRGGHRHGGFGPRGDDAPAEGTTDS